MTIERLAGWVLGARELLGLPGRAHNVIYRRLVKGREGGRTWGATQGTSYKMLLPQSFLQHLVLSAKYSSMIIVVKGGLQVIIRNDAGAGGGCDKRMGGHIMPRSFNNSPVQQKRLKLL